MEVVIGSWGNKLVAPEHPRHAIMHDVQVGDVIFHWVGKNNTKGVKPGLYGYSTVTGELKRDTGTWKDEKANEIHLTGYKAFESPIYLEEIREYSTEILSILESLKASTSETTYFPFQEHKGFGVKPNQRYLTKFPFGLVSTLPGLAFLSNTHSPSFEPRSMTALELSSTKGLFEPKLEHLLAESAFHQTVRHYECKGYNVKTAAEGSPYDLVATSREDERHLVITWSDEEIDNFNVHRSVCEHAIAFQQTDLVVVSSIPWNRHSDGKITTGLGRLSIQAQWVPDTAKLRPISYEYSINATLNK